MFRRTFFIVIVVVVAGLGLGVTTSGARSLPAVASVAYVEGDVLTVQVGPGVAVRDGDLVAVARSNGHEHHNLGIWQVTGVGKGVVKAEPLCPTGVPVAGDEAVVLASGSRTTMAPAATPAYVPARPAAVEDLGDEIEIHVQLLFADSGAERRRGARTLYRHYRNDAQVQQVAEEVLLSGYNMHLDDRHHVDAMAWLCNILGRSRHPGYAGALSEVAHESASAKIRDYARSNLHRLG